MMNSIKKVLMPRRNASKVLFEFAIQLDNSLILDQHRDAHLLSERKQKNNNKSNYIYTGDFYSSSIFRRFCHLNNILI